MSNVNFIQLREQDSLIRSDIPGSYSTVLDKSLTLENNDVLSINSVFCDTRHSNPSTGRIDINDDNDNFQISYGYYLVNGTSLNNADFTFTDETAPTARNIAKPDCKKYVLSYSGAGNSDLFAIKEFAFTGQDQKTFQGFDITFKFVPAHAGLPNTILLHCPKQDGNGGLVKVMMPKNKGTENFELDGIIIKGTGDGGSRLEEDFLPIKPDPIDMQTEDGITNPNGSDDGSPYQVNAESVIVGATLLPLINTFEFTIPQNSYTPDSLAKLITDKMTAYKHGSTSPSVFTEDTETVRTVNEFCTRNAFFTSHKQLQSDTTYGLSTLPQFFLVSEDGETILSINRNSANNYIIGASQMALEYDDTLNKFLFTQIHTNLFDANNAPIISYVPLGAGNFNLQGTHSGVFFTATNTDTHQLLFNDMGFDSNLLVPPYTPTVEKSFDGVLVNSKVFTVSLIEGVNITSNLDTSDAGLKHNQDFAIAPDPAGLTNITSIELNSIIGSNNKGGGGGTGQLKEGYFLVEISGIPSNNLINSINNNISCIVSKYQATEDFTISIERAGAIEYQHKGEPLMISKLDVRILDPNGQPSSNIGNNNTVFIELIKSNST